MPCLQDPDRKVHIPSGKLKKWFEMQAKVDDKVLKEAARGADLLPLPGEITLGLLITEDTTTVS
jgi:hypothetical protein